MNCYYIFNRYTFSLFSKSISDQVGVFGEVISILVVVSLGKKKHRDNGAIYGYNG